MVILLCELNNIEISGGGQHKTLLNASRYMYCYVDNFGRVKILASSKIIVFKIKQWCML